jgi:hypothetical protein
MAWKAKQLSFAGRVTLAKSVMEAIPIYPMMTNKIPKACLDDIHRLQRNFIWGETDNARKYHAVGWDVVTTPKRMGGLGLRRLDVMNQACLLKLGWKIHTGAKEFWCDVIRGKYECNDLSNGAEIRSSDSSFWKAIRRLSSHMIEASFWTVGDGCDIEAWRHAWIKEGYCIADDNIAVPQELWEAKVCDLVDSNGEWNWQILGDWLPNDIKRKIEW